MHKELNEKDLKLFLTLQELDPAENKYDIEANCYYFDVFLFSRKTKKSIDVLEKYFSLSDWLGFYFEFDYDEHDDKEYLFFILDNLFITMTFYHAYAYTEEDRKDYYKFVQIKKEITGDKKIIDAILEGFAFSDHEIIDWILHLSGFVLIYITSHIEVAIWIKIFTRALTVYMLLRYLLLPIRYRRELSNEKLIKKAFEEKLKDNALLFIKAKENKWSIEDF